MKKHIGEIRIKDLKAVARAERFVEELCDYYHISDEYFANVMLASTEAVRLMITRGDVPSEVTLAAVKTNKGLKFSIERLNKKEVFNSDTDPLDAAIESQQLTRELFIIKSLSDELKVHDHGRKIDLTFYITSLNAETSIWRIEKLKDYFRTKPKLVKDKDG